MSNTRADGCSDSEQSQAGSADGSGADSDNALDEASEALVKAAPLHAHIGSALERCFPSLPAEVTDLLTAKGAQVAGCEHLKTSFHLTFLASLDPPLYDDAGARHSRVIVQVLGAQLGDKPVFGQLSAACLLRAAELAASAGVRVPRILAVGECASSCLGGLDFVVEEFIDTQTIEDEVCAPMDHWHRIAGEVRTKLCKGLITNENTEPLPRFNGILAQLQWLLDMVPSWDVELRKAVAEFKDDVETERPAVCPPVLLHQDLNCGNLLCSPSVADGGAWMLDAVIDWESAVIADPFTLSGEDPWRTACQFALVVKGSALADRYVHGRLPRCELRELVECYDQAAHGMEDAGLLKHRPWAALVALARASAAACER